MKPCNYSWGLRKVNCWNITTLLTLSYWTLLLIIYQLFSLKWRKASPFFPCSPELFFPIPPFGTSGPLLRGLEVRHLCPFSSAWTVALAVFPPPRPPPPDPPLLYYPAIRWSSSGLLTANTRPRCWDREGSWKEVTCSWTTISVNTTPT